MGFESFIAKRYLVSKHKVNFITIISIISILGITVGVAALIVVLSVFNGFGSLVSQYLMNLDPDIKITATTIEGEKKLEEIPGLLNEIDDVQFLSPFVDGKVLAYNQGITQVVNLKGIEAESSDKLYNIDENVLYGKANFSTEKNVANVVLGLQLADRLQVITGDTLLLISPVGIERAITQFSLPLSKKVVVRGIFNSNNNDYDAGYIFSAIEPAQHLLGYKKSVQGFEAKLTDTDHSSSVKNILEEKLNENDFSISTWYDFHQELYSVMQIERWTAYIILSLIIAVATFNILGSLSMSVIEKQRDIGILRSMGVRENSILKIFMFEGILIGIIGTLIGVILGYLICYIQIEFNIYPLNPAQYKIDALPIELRFSDFFFISGASMILAFLASLYPAKKAAKVNPISAIKWE
ncbi:MAG: ABC transporter permease [Ignavibacteria bacterium]|nr:ABC transporter permease [Ignavibacteria bacterium]MBT8381998.1 ABC transporter permease [Ignavibacteria bacterium]MBT8390208.1 ABC transporter permease [Ignavibacteria bacterium]NNJ53467.1 ABC transporter permease [Ignavibacteriaceae bacterium]NNL21192.1 ABC transporter permease [Ignavibacteriaceae bacterium]